MNIFLEGTRKKLRFETSKGNLSIEQLWDLSLEELDALAVSLEEAHATSGKKSFLVTRSVKSKIAKLKFDIVLAVLNTILEAENEAAKAQETKQHNARINELIAKKQEEALAGKTVEELEAMLK